MSSAGTINDFMIPLVDYPHVRADATLRDVYAKLRASYDSAELFRSVLVLDEKDRLVGMLGLKDMLHALLPDYLRGTKRHEGATEDISALAALWQDDCREAYRSAHQIIIRNHITPIPTAIHAGDPLTTAVFIFATSHVNLLPVVDGKQVVGVLRLVDVLNDVTREVLSEGTSS